MTAHRMFVYGTLRVSEPNHRLLAGAELVGPARTDLGFRLYDLGAFPGMVAVGTCRVAGELVLVDDRIRARVDELEGHPRFYQRTPIRLDDGSVAEAYLLPKTSVVGRPIIRAGDWCRRRT
jgi:gamma-glutamylcyclotransferase (GGCT)/AIG2-like uncharacterized protein YtfP